MTYRAVAPFCEVFGKRPVAEPFFFIALRGGGLSPDASDQGTLGPSRLTEGFLEVYWYGDSRADSAPRVRRRLSMGSRAAQATASSRLVCVRGVACGNTSRQSCAVSVRKLNSPRRRDVEFSGARGSTPTRYPSPVNAFVEDFSA